jgi:RNA polymerase sigma factor (sigma-70 family)
MKSAVSTSFVRDLDALYQVGAVGGLSDRELVTRFTNWQDAAAEWAFEAIVHRHGPMVWAVCRRAVPDEQAAEDAFQATFLVLAIKAGSILRRESLGPWLHGVAARIARRAGVRASRWARESREPRSLATVPARAEEGEIDAAELRAVLDQEIERLPAAYRRAIVLCYLEGKTQEAAALELGWTKGTVSGRLARAKDLLRARLTRRGFAPSAGLTGIVRAGEDARAAVPAELARETVRAGLNAALGRAELIAASGSAAALARGTLRTMMLGQLKVVFAALVVFFTIATTLAHTIAGPERSDKDASHGERSAIRPQPARPGRTPPPALKLPQHARARLGTTRLRHEGFMANVAFAPDGKTLASIGWDGAVRFWDVTTGEPATKLPEIEGAGRSPSAAFSPDGTRLAVGRDSFLQLWDLTTGKEFFRSPVLKGGVREIVFSPEGKTLATATEESDPAVRIWDVATGQVRKTLVFDKPLTYRGRPMSFAPDGRRLAVGTSASVGPKKTAEIIGIWDVDSGSRPLVIRDVHGDTLTSLAFAPDGKTLLSGGSDSRPNRDERRPGEKLELSPKIRVWDASTGRSMREFDMAHLEGHCAFTVSRDGRTLTSLHPDRLIVWDLAASKAIRTIPIERYDPGVGIGGCLAMSPDVRILAAARGDNAVHLWDLETGRLLVEQPGAHQGEITSVAIAPDGRLIATGDLNGLILLSDATRGKYASRVDLGGRGFVRSVQFAPDGRTLAGAAMYFDREAFGFRGIVRLWELPGGTVRREFQLDADPVQLAYSPDGRRLAIATAGVPDPPRGAFGGDEGIQVFEIANGRKCIGLRDRRGPVYAMAFSPDGKTLASVEADMIFRFWDLATGRTTREIPIEGHREGAKTSRPGDRTHLRAADLTPDLSLAVTAGAFDDQFLVWDLGTGRVRRTFQIETYYDAKVALSPNGRFLAAAVSPLVAKGGAMMSAPGRDTTIRIWEIATKREVLRLEPKSGAVRSLAFSPDGKTLVSGMADTTAIIWDCSTAYRTPANPPD